MNSVFCLFISDLLQKHCEKEHACWVPGPPATGSASTCSGVMKAARAGLQALLGGGKGAQPCRLHVPTGAACDTQALRRIPGWGRHHCHFVPSQVLQAVTEEGEEYHTRQARSKAPANGSHTSCGFTASPSQRNEP